MKRTTTPSIIVRHSLTCVATLLQTLAESTKLVLPASSPTRRATILTAEPHFGTLRGGLSEETWSCFCQIIQNPPTIVLGVQPACILMSLQPQCCLGGARRNHREGHHRAQVLLFDFTSSAIDTEQLET